MKNLLKKLHRDEQGMESIQVIMILAAAAVIITGLVWVWSNNKQKLSDSVESHILDFGGNMENGGGTN